MAVDPKTGKPADPGELVVRELISRLLSDDIVDEDGRPVPPLPAEPRGVSAMRGAYGPWLAAQEWAKSEAKGASRIRERGDGDGR